MASVFTILSGPLGLGGSGKVIVQQAADFSAAGYCVDLLIHGRDGPLLEALPHDVRVRRLATLHPLWGTLPLAWYLSKARPDGILVHRLRLLRPLLRARRLAGVSCRLAAVIHTSLSAQLRTDGGDPKRLLRNLRRLSGCDSIVAVSAQTARDAEMELGLSVNAIRVAYPPVHAGELRALAAAHEELQLPARYIIGIGRLEAQKDFASLMRAFALVCANDVELELVILGEGRERKALEKQAADLGIEKRVHMPGYLRNPYPWLARARLLALSSRWEGFGLVLAEALALGVPVVATDCPSGPREILADGRYGMLVPPGDAEGLAAAIRSTLDKPIESELLRQAAARFSAPAATRTYLEALGIASTEN